MKVSLKVSSQVSPEVSLDAARRRCEKTDVDGCGDRMHARLAPKA